MSININATASNVTAASVTPEHLLVVKAPPREEFRSVQTIVKRIRRRDPSLRSLWLHKGVVCTRVEGRDLLLALQASSSSLPSVTTTSSSRCASSCKIESVRISRGLYAGLREVVKWQSLIGVLGQLPCLQELIVEDNLSVRDAGTLLEVLQLLQRQLPHLKRLYLGSSHAIHTVGDVLSIAFCLMEANQLQEFVARDVVCCGNNNNNNNDPRSAVATDLSPLMFRLSALPNLTSVEIGIRTGKPHSLPPTISVESLRAICRRDQMTSLKLQGFALSVGHIHVLVEELGANSSLRDLHLGAFTTNASTGDLLLNHEENGNQQQQEIDCLVALIQLMENHQFTIQNFTVDVVMAPLPTSLDNNDIIQREYCLQQYENKLQKLCLLQDQLASFCTLNRAKRHAFLEGSTRGRHDLLELLLAVHEDVNAIYYLLSRNPSFISGSGSDTMLPRVKSSLDQLEV